MLSNFYKAANKVSDRSRQNGLQYAFEGYIQDIGYRRSITLPVTVKKIITAYPTNRDGGWD